MNKKSLFLLFIIIIIAAFFRLYNITQTPPGLYPDEAMNGNNAIEALTTAPPTDGFKIFYPENNGREGLFINIQALSIALFGNFPWALRLVSAIFGILTVLGIYFLTKELFNDKIALLSSFFLATGFWHINFSRIGFRAIMAPAFLVWSVFLLLKTLNRAKNDFQSNSKFIMPAVLGGIFYGLGFHSYIAYRATPLLILIIVALYWFQNKERQIRRKILLSTFYFLLTTFIVAAPLGYYFIKNPQDFFGRTTQISVFNSPTPIKDLTANIVKTAGMFNFNGDYNWRHNYAGKSLLFWPVGILFIIGIIKGIFSVANVAGKRLKIREQATLRTRTPSEGEQGGEQCASEQNFDAWRLIGEKKFPFIMLFSWLIIAALPVIVSNEGIPHALRAILMAPPIFILAGFGGVYIYKKIKDTALINESSIRINFLRLSAVAFLIILIIQGYKSYFINWGRNPDVRGAFAQNYVDIGRELNALPNPPAGGLPKYVIVEASGVDVRGIPMPSQTIMFITNTFTPEKQKEKNIFYVPADQKDLIPKNGYIKILK